MSTFIYRFISISSSVVIFLLAGRPLLQAQLYWQQTAVERTAVTGASEVEARFGFKNPSKQAVRILAVTSSCGCTTATADKASYAPDETGVITARFTIGDRVGRHVKVITVQSLPTPSEDEANGRPEVVPQAVTSKELTLTVDIPEVLKVNPAFVVWQLGEEAQPKRIQIEASSDWPVADLKVSVGAAAVRAEVETREPGRVFEIVVVPESTASTMSVVIQITA